MLYYKVQACSEDDYQLDAVFENLFTVLNTVHA